jgi:hypothetical protein
MGRWARIGFVAAWLMVTTEASADQTLAEPAAIWTLPSSGGALFDLSTGSWLGLVAWTIEVPVGARDWQTPHRAFLEPAMAIGRQPDGAEIAWVTFRPRFGYRYVPLPSATVSPVIGAGTASEFWPEARASFSHELGLRAAVYTDCRRLTFACYPSHVGVVARVDVFTTSERTLALSMLGTLSAF